MNQFVLFSFSNSGVSNPLEILCSILTCLATLFTTVFAGAALVISVKEYNAHKKREKADILNRFNERYCDNETIQKVVCYLYQKAYSTHQEANHNKIKTSINDNDIELFLRFFEEIQHSIMAGLIDEKDTRNILAFYGMLAYESPRIQKYINVEKNNWSYYIAFCERMKLIKPLSKEDMGNINNK